LMMAETKFDEGDGLPAVEKLITQEQIERYAVASGDFNPIHVDHEFAASSQFGRTIAHGMLVTASISEMMTLAFGETWPQSGRLKIRFKAPVYPGDKISTFGEVKSVRDRDGARTVACSIGVRTDKGEVAIAGDASVVVPLSNDTAGR
jgi:acyl dehydratase